MTTNNNNNKTFAKATKYQQSQLNQRCWLPESELYIQMAESFIYSVITCRSK